DVRRRTSQRNLRSPLVTSAATIFVFIRVHSWLKNTFPLPVWRGEFTSKKTDHARGKCHPVATAPEGETAVATAWRGGNEIPKSLGHRPPADRRAIARRVAEGRSHRNRGRAGKRRQRVVDPCLAAPRRGRKSNHRAGGRRGF